MPGSTIKGTWFFYISKQDVQLIVAQEQKDYFLS